MNCKQAARLLSEQQERALKLREQAPLRLHLLGCTLCRHYKTQLSFLRDASRRYLDADRRG